MRSTFEETVFRQKSVFRTFDVFDIFGDFSEGGFGCFLKDFDGFVIILARNPDEKCCQGFSLGLEILLVVCQGFARGLP